MSTDVAQPPRFCPECGHKSGDGPCSTCKPYGRPCTWCLHSGPVPTDQEPPAVPPIDPDSMPSAEPPPMPETLDGFRSTSWAYGHMIDEYRNGWAVMQQAKNGAVVSEKHFFKSRGHERSHALEYAQQQHAKKNGGS